MPLSHDEVSTCLIPTALIAAKRAGMPARVALSHSLCVFAPLEGASKFHFYWMSVSRCMHFGFPRGWDFVSAEALYPCLGAVRQDREHLVAQLGLGHSPRSRSPLRHTHVTQELGKLTTQPNLLLGPFAGGEEGLRGCGADRVASCSATTCSIDCVLDLSICLPNFSCPQKGFTHVVTRPCLSSRP